MKLGQTTVTFVPDAEVRGGPGDFFPGSDWTAYQHLLDERGQAVANVGSFLIRTRSVIVLVDLGLGSGGTLLENLAAEGVTPGDVDLVVFTHLHRDHVGWTGAFPRARYLVERREWEYWCVNPGGVGPDRETVLRPLSSKIEFLDQLPTGLHAVATPGHTPGHTSLLVTDPDADEQLLILGDLLHTRAQLTEPGWRFRSDVDAVLARQQRVDVLARYRDGRTVIAGGHFAGNVFGER
jgi:glyoxylase-like metal-dependent hydrolase (beta-lactamase superfamily II)